MSAILKEAESGGKTGEVVRRHGISKETFYRWRKKSGGMQVSEAGLEHLGLEGCVGKGVVTLNGVGKREFLRVY